MQNVRNALYMELEIHGDFNQVGHIEPREFFQCHWEWFQRKRKKRQHKDVMLCWMCVTNETTSCSSSQLLLKDHRANYPQLVAG